MKGVISNFRMAKHHTTGNQLVILPEGSDSKERAEDLVGKIVTWETPAKNSIKGKVTGAHGTKGAVRVLFEKGMPGQALGTKVKIE